MRVLIVGGTGFIGYHSVREFLRRGFEVTVLALPPMPKNDLFPDDVKVILSDINRLNDEFLKELLCGCYAVVFAAGADDRTLPRSPAYEFYYKANVKSSERLFRLARDAGVKRGVLISSYFAHYDRIWPEMKLSFHHPYIRSRIEQESVSLESSLPDLELVILELPYVFGSMPGRPPLWKHLINYIRLPIPLFYTKGGTNCVSVKNVAEAVVGAVEYGRGGERYLIGDENITWHELLGRLCFLIGRNKRVVELPTTLVRFIMRAVYIFFKLRGRESGLDPVEMVRLHTMNTFFDPGPSKRILKHGGGGLNEALSDTVMACMIEE